MGRFPHDDGSRRKKGGGGRALLILAALAAWVVLREKKPRPGVQPPAVVEAPAESPPEGFARYDWPRAAGDAKVELASDLTQRNYYVILDGSGSMSDRGCSGSANKISAAKTALAEFAKAVPSGAKLGLLVFDALGTSERVPLGVGNRDRFREVVQSVNASGGTPLRSAIALGLDKLEEQARRQLGYGEYNLVVVTDGEASGTEDPRAVVKDILARSPVTIHTIGFCIGENHSLNQPGRTLYKAAQNPEQLRAGLEDVLAESASFDASAFQEKRGG